MVKLDEISSWNSTKLSDGNGKSEGASGSYGKYGPSETQVEKRPLGSSQYKSLLALPDARQAYLQRKSRRKSIAKNAVSSRYTYLHRVPKLNVSHVRVCSWFDAATKSVKLSSRC